MKTILCLLAVLTLSGCVSFHAIEQKRVDQGRPLLNGEPDPNAPVATRKIVGIDIHLPPGPGKKEEENLPPPVPDPATAPKTPEKVIEFLPMQNTTRADDAQN